MGEQNVLKLVSPIPPSVNHYLAYRTTISKSGKAIGLSYCTAEAKRYRKQFKEYVEQEVIKQGWNLQPNTKQHFYVDGSFYFPRIDMDANNYWKIPLDAITDTQLVWVDDNVVCERVQRICYDSDNPRVEFVITPVSYIGIFDNAAQFDSFIEANCIGCKKFKRNCSILNKAIDGRVQECVTNKNCTKKSAAKT